ncbi:MAG TPA: hypothetical protein VGF59_37380, partial [Bryobacteraceae bacterium]
PIFNLVARRWLSIPQAISTSQTRATIGSAGDGVVGYSGDGGSATNARTGAWGVAFDSSGKLYLADPWNNDPPAAMRGVIVPTPLRCGACDCESNGPALPYIMGASIIPGAVYAAGTIQYR